MLLLAILVHKEFLVLRIAIDWVIGMICMFSLMRCEKSGSFFRRPSFLYLELQIYTSTILNAFTSLLSNNLDHQLMAKIIGSQPYHYLKEWSYYNHHHPKDSKTTQKKQTSQCLKITE